MSGWHQQAACRGMDTNIFFESGREKEAKAVCKNCPVRKECALEGAAGNEDGIWGGLSPKQRRKIRREIPAEERIRRATYVGDTATISRAPKPSRLVHGTHAGYNTGCRCDACTAGERVYSRERFRARSAS